ncbi:MAG: NAD(P)/FAD-dependent oxidoreductase [Ktedonobacteraceae bacterium]
MTTNNITTEILIIGGGITGASTAYFLTQAGHEVILLERNDLASEASGLNAGTLWQMGPGTSPDLTNTLSMEGLQIFEMLQSELGYDIEFRQSGALKAIQTEEELDFLQKEVQQLKSQGYNLELLSIHDAQSIEPELSSALLGCLYYPLGASANPIKTTRAFASAAQNQGAHLFTRHEVVSLHYLENIHYKVVTSTGIFEAQTLVLAAGPWCRDIGSMLQLHIPVYSVRGQMWSTVPVPSRLFHAIGATESTLYWHRNPHSDKDIPSELTHHDNIRLTRHLYGRQTLNGEIIFGGDRQLTRSKTPDKVGIETNRNHVIEIFPFLRQLPIKRIWAGLMPFTSNLEPIIGKIPQYENLYIVTGLGSSGFEQGSMAGKLLAECIHSQQDIPILSSADPIWQVSDVLH